jgi:hypothetical protein
MSTNMSQILREEGLKKYARAIAMISGPEAKLFRFLKHKIQAHHIGPDSYWRPFDKAADSKSHRNFYGNAWWIPFPPTLVCIVISKCYSCLSVYRSYAMMLVVTLFLIICTNLSIISRKMRILRSVGEGRCAWHYALLINKSCYGHTLT